MGSAPVKLPQTENPQPQPRSMPASLQVITEQPPSAPVLADKSEEQEDRVLKRISNNLRYEQPSNKQKIVPITSKFDRKESKLIGNKLKLVSVYGENKNEDVSVLVDLKGRSKTPNDTEIEDEVVAERRRLIVNMRGSAPPI